MTTQEYALAVLVVTTIGAATCGELRTNRLEVELIEKQLQVDSLQGEKLALDLVLDGWDAEFGNVSADSARSVIEANNARLLAQIDSANLRATLYARTTVRVRDSIVSVAEGVVPDTVLVEHGVPTLWEGSVFRGVFEGHWAFTRSIEDNTGALDLNLFAEIPAEIVAIDAGASMVFGVRPIGDQPGVSISVEEFVYPKPPPPNCRSCDRAWWDRWWIEIPVAGLAGWFLHEAVDDVRVEYVR
jgi:hypothetical protein